MVEKLHVHHNGNLARYDTSPTERGINAYESPDFALGSALGLQKQETRAALNSAGLQGFLAERVSVFSMNRHVSNRRKTLALSGFTENSSFQLVSNRVI